MKAIIRLLKVLTLPFMIIFVIPLMIFSFFQWIAMGSSVLIKMVDKSDDYLDWVFKEKEKPVSPLPLKDEVICENFLKAGREFWKDEYKREMLHNRPLQAVKYVRNEETGHLAIFTRGEYSQDLIKFIESL